MITLSIIGVVAAMTLPSLIQKNVEKTTVAQLKKTYSAMSQAYLKLSVSSGKIMVSKVDIVEMGSQDPQAVEAYVNAAVKHMSPAKQVALAARILKFAQQEGGTDC